MTKLEKKLSELGYEYFGLTPNGYCYIKSVNGRIDLKIIYDKTYRNRINGWKVNYYKVSITSQKDIDNLQQAFNIMQKDLEVLKEYE